MALIADKSKKTGDKLERDDIVRAVTISNFLDTIKSTYREHNPFHIDEQM